MKQGNQNLTDTELEGEILAILILYPETLDNAQKKLGKLGSKTFLNEEARLLYETALKLKEQGKPVNPLTIKEALRKQAKGEQIPFLFLAELLSHTLSIKKEDLDYYLGEQKDKAIKRLHKGEAEKYLGGISNGKDPIEAKQDLDKSIADIETNMEKEKIGLTALESLAAPNKESPSPVKGGICEPGRYTIIGATDGEGKTTLMFQFALCAVTGTTFLGLFPIPEAVKVIYFCGENVKPDIDAKLTKQIAELEKIRGDVVAKYLENLILVYPDQIQIQLDKENSMGWLRTRLHEYNPDIVIFDPLNEFVSSSTSLNDDTIARKTAKALNKVAREFDCIPFITTHFKKKDEIEPESIFEKFHGSKYWTNPAVAQIAMYRANQQKYETAKHLEFKFKTVETPPRILVMRDRDSLWYSETTPDEFSKAKLQPKHVLEILLRKFNGKAIPTIFDEVAAEELSCSQRQIQALVKLAKEEGLIKKEHSLYVPIEIKKRGKGKPGTTQKTFDENLPRQTSLSGGKSKKMKKTLIDKGLQKTQSPRSKGEVKAK